MINETVQTDQEYMACFDWKVISSDQCRFIDYIDQLEIILIIQTKHW